MSARELADALLRGDVGFTLGCRLWMCWRLLVAPRAACATLITLTEQGIVIHEALEAFAAQGMSARQGENSRSEVEAEGRQPGPPEADAPNSFQNGNSPKDHLHDE